MSLTLHIQNMTDSLVPSDKSFRHWAGLALDEAHPNAELTLRIVDKDEAKSLNKQWRDKDYATNVLSFPVGERLEHAPGLLGDIVICADIVEQEAKQQGKPRDAHWAHLTIHGVLHLQGYDHETDDDANIMERKEKMILDKAGYADPYQLDCIND